MALGSSDSESSLLAQHEGLVVRIAHETATRYKLQRFFEDLLAYGRQGLLEAMRRFDPDNGARFSTFAYYRIRGAMLDGCRSMGLSERGSRRQMLAESIFGESQASRVEQRPEEQVPLPELFEELDEMVCELGSIHLLADCAALERVASEQANAEDELELQQSLKLMHVALQRLEPLERRILEKSFFEGLSVDELAKQEGCSKGWASRLRKAALAELRKQLCRLE